jgi:hypothetical protein
MISLAEASGATRRWLRLLFHRRLDAKNGHTLSRGDRVIVGMSENPRIGLLIVPPGLQGHDMLFRFPGGAGLVVRAQDRKICCNEIVPAAAEKNAVKLQGFFRHDAI